MNQKIEDNGKKLLAILNDSKNKNEFKLFLKSNVININQFLQAFNLIGLKPDLNGKIIPTPINTSLIRGFQNYEQFWISAKGSRKALIVNYHEVSNSGYLSRKFALLTMDSRFTHEECCDTKHPINLYIDSIDTYSRIIGRFTFPDNTLIRKEDFDKYKNKTIKIYSPITCTSKVKTVDIVLNSSKIIQNDNQLRGEIKKFLSPSKILVSQFLLESDKYDAIVEFNNSVFIYYFNSNCNKAEFLEQFSENCSDKYDDIDEEIFNYLINEKKDYCIIKVYRKHILEKKGICKRCYGTQYEYIKEYVPGLYGEKRFSNFVLQKFLSTKHLLQCIIKEISYPDLFLKYFNVTSNTISLNPEYPELTIRINKGLVEMDHDMDLFFDTFIVVDGDQEVEIKMDIDQLVYIKYDRLTKISSTNSEYYEILENDDEEDPSLFMKVSNIELSKTIRRVLRLIENPSSDQTYDSILNSFTLLINEASLDKEFNLASLEIIIKNLVRNKLDITKDLDFSKEEVDPHFIINLQNAILSSKKPAVILSFERFEKFQKEMLEPVKGTSLFDNIFVN
jgi:hypothetical protein